MTSPPVSLKAQQLSRVFEACLALDSTMPVIQAAIFLYVASRDRGPSTGATGLEIAEALQIDASRVSRNLLRLDEAGLITRDRVEMGQKRAQLTKEGARYRDHLVHLIS